MAAVHELGDWRVAFRSAVQRAADAAQLAERWTLSLSELTEGALYELTDGATLATYTAEDGDSARDVLDTLAAALGLVVDEDASDADECVVDSEDGPLWLRGGGVVVESEDGVTIPVAYDAPGVSPTALGGQAAELMVLAFGPDAPDGQDAQRRGVDGAEWETIYRDVRASATVTLFGARAWLLAEHVAEALEMDAELPASGVAIRDVTVITPAAVAVSTGYERRATVAVDLGHGRRSRRPLSSVLGADITLE